jgi:hypothetical protein
MHNGPFVEQWTNEYNRNYSLIYSSQFLDLVHPQSTASRNSNDIKVWIDPIGNRGAIDLTKDNRHHQQSKHIEIVHHFICECVEDKTFAVIHYSSAEMLEDGFTKPLLREPFGRMVDRLGLILG